MTVEQRRPAIRGCILGTAVGDALGLPYEGMSHHRQLKLAPRLNGPQFFLGRGLVSDDTEHTCIVASALIQSAGEPDQFERSMARCLQRWILALPPGTGLATLKACARLCAGIAPNKSGVFSAGNGPAMRSALLGVCCDGDFERLREWVHVSTRITHTDPKSEAGAYAVALAAYFAVARRKAAPTDYVTELEAHLAGNENLPNETVQEMMELVRKAVESAARGEEAFEFAKSIGATTGVSGYILRTVPVVLQVWFKGADFKTAVTEIVRAGGDADSTGAILGAILGARDPSGIPVEWIGRLKDWPLTVRHMENLSDRLADVCDTRQAGVAPIPAYPWQLLRNLAFFLLVTGHVVRRALPPY